MSDQSSENNSSVALLDDKAPANGRAPSPETITANKIRTRWTDANNAQRAQTIQYWINRAFLLGHQWVYYNRATQQVARITFSDESRVRLTDNRLWPSTRTVMSKLLQRELTFEVAPVAADDASVRGAQIAESVLADRHRDDNWEALRSELAQATWLGGTGGLCVDWNAQKGTPLGTDEMTGKPYSTGEVSCAALTLPEMAVEPGVRDAERARWWIRAQALPPKEVQGLYHLAKEPATDAVAGAEPVTQRYVTDEVAPRQNLTMVLHYYERPTHLNPKGAVAVVVGNEIVDGPYPWPFPFKDRLNLVVSRETRVANRWTGDTVFSAAVPVQAAYNQSKSSMVEHLKLAGNARLMVDDDAIVGIADLSDLPAEVINYSSAASSGRDPAGWLAPANMPQWWLVIADKLAEDMDTILGVHDVSRGTASDQASSGVALSILQENDNTPVNGLAKEFAESWGRYASLVLEVYADKVTETRTARVGTGTKMPELIPWTGKDFFNQCDATVPLEQVLPRNRAAQWQVAVSMAQQGLLGTPPDPKLFAMIADLPGQEDLIEGLDADIAKARDENHDLTLGIVRIPREFDNHAEHITEHNRMRKSSRYESLDPKLQQVIDDHVKAHEVMAASEAGQQTLQGEVHPNLAASPAAHEPLPTPETAPAPAAPVVPAMPTPNDTPADATAPGAEPPMPGGM